MAELVLGVGSSHSPMVTMTGEDWLEWGRNDLRHPMLYTRDGRHVSYDERLADVGDTMGSLATLERCRSGAERVQAAVAELRCTLAEADLDAVVVVGDDQDEHLRDDNLPPFLVYWGDAITNDGTGDLDALTPLQRRYLPGYREPGGARSYPVASDLALHVIAEALAAGFDVASSRRLPVEGQGMGHAFGFPVRRLLDDALPLVPVMVNTYNAPSRPTAARCAGFGRLLRHAIGSFPSDGRVGLVASGGLSHFVVLEDLDREVLAALGRHDLDALTAIPEATYVAGTSEIKNWIVVAAACGDKTFEVVDYVPGYRTPAGTGTGLAFARWT
jgi:3-O-methylgallate 3,4-dioxygenase